MIGFFEYQYLKFKKKHLENLVALARADGEFHEKERKFLYEIGLKYKLKPHQIDAVIEHGKSSKPRIPKAYPEKMAQLYDTVGMMLADGVIEESEMEFCRDIFKKYGMKEELIRVMIDAYQKGGVVEPEEWENFLEQQKRFQEK